MKLGVKASLLSILTAAYGDTGRQTATTHSAACATYAKYVQAWDAAVAGLAEGDVVVLRFECDSFHRNFPGIKLSSSDIEVYVSNLKIVGSVVGD